MVARARVFLDEAFPLEGTSHADARRYHVHGGALLVDDMPLMEPEKFIGYRGHPRAPEAVLLRNNGLHVQLIFDRTHPIGSRDQAGLADVRLESAVSAIMDCEDSVACVDAEDKVTAYRNWLGLMRATSWRASRRAAAADPQPQPGPHLHHAGRRRGLGEGARADAGAQRRAPDDQPRDPRPQRWRGFRGADGRDGDDTDRAARPEKDGRAAQLVTGSVYVVKPKMHGPDEVAFADETFTHVEAVLGLPRHTVKLGIMDEERRTSVNLKECIRAARHRLVFINTGFLDRTGDEIHTSMEAGPFSRKEFIKRKGWIIAYENQNVDIGLECGLSGRAQIGKGMWAVPDRMAAMLETKIEHPKAGANCAWVPSHRRCRSRRRSRRAPGSPTAPWSAARAGGCGTTCTSNARSTSPRRCRVP